MRMKPKNFIIIVTVTIIISSFNQILCPGPEMVMDDQYRQANVPPVVAVMFDVPSYAKKELYKWHDYVQANTYVIAKNRRKNNEVLDKFYKDKLTRMGKLRAMIGN
jgi:hypothetical protein